MDTLQVMSKNAKLNTDEDTNSDLSSNSQIKKLDANWFDHFVDKQNISLDD